jgi:hypothetical protein
VSDDPAVPRRREQQEDARVSSSDLARLQERLRFQQQDVEDLSKRVDDYRESQEGIKRAFHDAEMRVANAIGELRTFMARELGEMKGAATGSERSFRGWHSVIGLVFGGLALAISAAAFLLRK